MYTVEEFDEEKTKVMKYIVYKRRTEKEIRTKFAGSIEEDILEDIIEYLKEAKYIDDKEYVEKAVNNIKTLKNLSIKEIKYKLLAKGIKSDDIEDYCYENSDELEEYELKSAQNIVAKKSKDYDEDELKMYLLKKGYKPDIVRSAIKEKNTTY